MDMLHPCWTVVLFSRAPSCCLGWRSLRSSRRRALCNFIGTSAFLEHALRQQVVVLAGPQNRHLAQDVVHAHLAVGIQTLHGRWARAGLRETGAMPCGARKNAGARCKRLWQSCERNAAAACSSVPSAHLPHRQAHCAAARGTSWFGAERSPPPEGGSTPPRDPAAAGTHHVRSAEVRK